jgi:hypothetical protein
MALTLDIKNDLRYQQGEKQGKQKGLIATAREMIKKGFNNGLISEITKLPIEDIEAIRMKLQSADKRKK